MTPPRSLSPTAAAQAFFLAISTVLLPSVQADFSNTCSTSGKTTVWLPLDNCKILLPGTPTIHSWGALVGVAKQGADIAGSRQYCLSPSTVGNDTILMDVDICAGADKLNNTSPAQCASRRGHLIDGSQLDSVPVADLAKNPGWETFSDPFQGAAKVVMDLVGSTVDMLVGLVTESVNSNQHQIGLATDSTMVNALHSAGRIKSKCWGLNSGSTSDQPRQGSLVFGGFDQSSMESDAVSFAMTYPEVIGNRHCSLQVKVRQIDLEIITEAGVNNITMLSGPASEFSSCIEPNDRLLRLPGTLGKNFRDILKELTNVTTVESDTLQKKSDFYILEPGLAFPSSQNNFKMSLKFTFGNNFTVEVPDHEMKRQLRGLGPDGSDKVDADHIELSIFSQTDVADAASLGRAVLSQIYLFVDQEQSTFYLAKQNTQADIPQTKAWECDDVAEVKGVQIEKGVLAGIIVASVAGGALIFAVLYFCVWRKCRGAKDI